MHRARHWCVQQFFRSNPSQLLVLLGLLLGLYVVTMPGGVLAQTHFPSVSPAEQPARPTLTPPSFLPIDSSGSKTPYKLPPIGQVLPPSSQDRIVVERVNFEGNTVFSDEELEQVVDSFIGQAIDSVQGLESMRIEVTKYYIDAGYINSGALIKNMNDGPSGNKVIDMRIVEGRLTDIQVSGLGRLTDSYVINKIWPDESEVLDIDKLRANFQYLLLDPLFDKVHSRLLPSDKRGDARLELEVKRSRPWDAYVAMDNYRSPAAGEYQLQAGGTVHNLTSLGDSLSLSSSRPVDGEKTYSAVVNWRVPLPVKYGTVMNASYKIGKTTITEEPFDEFIFSNDSSDWSVAVLQPLVQSLEHDLSVDFGYRQRESQNYIDGNKYTLTLGEREGFTKNKAAIVGVSHTHRKRNYSFSTRLTYTRGEHNHEIAPAFIGILTKRNSPYSIYLLEGLLDYRLGSTNMILELRSSWQYSNDYLLGMDRFSVTSSSGVRGYIENSNNFDTGSVNKIELYIPLPRLADNLTMSVTPFGDYGFGQNNVASYDDSADARRRTFKSAGVQLEANLYGVSMTLTYARALENEDRIEEGHLQSKGLSFALHYRF